MRPEYAYVIALLIGLTLLLSTNTESAGLDYEGLVDGLQKQGIEARLGGQVAQPFMPVTGHELTLDGETLQAYEFPNKELADSFAETVSEDGSAVDEKPVTWPGPVHFYRSGRIIVIYVGEKAGTEETLTSVLGKQFAGSPTRFYCTTRTGVCIELYNPVCGWFSPDIQCVKYPCAQDFSNSCFACSDDNVLYYTEGACPTEE